MTLDKLNDLVVSVLKEYEEIKITGVDEDGVYFELQNMQYIVVWTDNCRFPSVFVLNNGEDYPHVMPTAKKWRSICLFESGTVVEYIHTDEEKIHTCIQRLIVLRELSSSGIVNEYQKEFLFYWKQSCLVNRKNSKKQYQLYLDHPEEFQWLEQQLYPSDTVRITRGDRLFNDADKKVGVATIPVLYLPIENARNLLPPLQNTTWTSKEINDIVNGVTYQRICSQASQEIIQCSYSRGLILLVFKLDTMFFGCFVEFKNAGAAKLAIKFESQIKAINPIDLSRCDFDYVNAQIGNEVHEEKTVVVGAGSLGSYIVGELARSGYKNITVIDDDRYDYANIFRHRLNWFSSTGCSKSQLIELETNCMHPEMNIRSVSDRLTVDTISKHIPADTQLIIFTIGSSDDQLRVNKAFASQCTQAVICYAWLEHDGKTSHVAIVKQRSEGCFECLFTDTEGSLCNNVINRANPETLEYSRNGCGGTRVRYGNRTLLSASALVLKALQDHPEHNMVYSYYEDAVHIQAFPKNERCACCGVYE